METYQRRIVLLLTENIFWFNGYSQTNGNRRGGFTLLSVTIGVQVVLWVRSSIRLSIWISPGNSDARVGLGNWVTNSAPFHLICRYSDSCNFASSKSLMQWADTRKQMRRTSTAPKEKRLTIVEQPLLHLEPMLKTLKFLLHFGLLRCDGWAAVFYLVS